MISEYKIFKQKKKAKPMDPKRIFSDIVFSK